MPKTLPDWVWPKNYFSRLIEWAPQGNCYGPQPSGVTYEDAEAFFGVRAEQVAHNWDWEHDSWNTRVLMVQEIMTELFRQIDVNHGGVRADKESKGA